MKNSFLSIAVLFAGLLVAGLKNADAVDVRFQGRMIDFWGLPTSGDLYVRYGSTSTPTTLAGPFPLKAGKYDIIQSIPSASYFALVYAPTGVTPDGDDANRKLDRVLYGHLDYHLLGYIPMSGNWFAAGANQSSRDLPSGNKWCGMVFRVWTYYDIGDDILEVHPDLLGETGQCPEDGIEKLQTQISQSFPKGNLISNGSFENNYEPSDARDYEKWYVAGAQFSSIYASMGTLLPHSGKKVAAVTYTAPASTWGAGYTEYSYLRSEYFPVRPNTKYLLSFYYSAKSPVNWSTHGVRPMIKTYSDRQGTEVFTMVSGRHGDTPYEESPNQWKRYIHPFETGADAVFGTLELLRTLNLGTGGTFYFDDVVLVEQSSLDLGLYGAAAEAHQALRVSNSTVFADGLNRPFLSRTQQSENKNLYSHTEYDVLNRSIRHSLPVNITATPPANGFFADVSDTAAAHYTGSGDYRDADGRAHTEKVYDVSPLGRVAEESSPGYLWRPGGGHTNRSFYSTTADTSGVADKPAPVSTSSAKYAYQFREGENGEISREFQDKFGRTIRKSSKIGGSWVNTEYRYDENGNMDTIIAPAGPGGSMQITRIRHNTLGMKIADSAGDYGDIRYIYGPSNQLRFSQSQAQRGGNRFSYVKYDTFDRVVETGEYLNANSFTEQQAAIADFPSRRHPLRRLRTQNYFDEIPDEEPDCYENGVGAGVYVIRAGTTEPGEFTTFVAAYNAAKSDLAGLSSYTGAVRFIQTSETPGFSVTPPTDDYEPIPLLGGAGPVPFTLTAMPLYQYLALVDANSIAFPSGISWGAVKGRLTKTVTCNEALRDALPGLKPLVKLFNYDKYGNTSAVYEYNGYLDDEQRWRKSTMRYDAQGRVVEKTRYNDLATDTLHEATLRYSYDIAGRVDTIRNGYDAVVAVNGYNPLGQLDYQLIGSDGIRVNYTYHLRGWPTSIVAHDAYDNILFSQHLSYENGTNPTYNGNISEYSNYMEGDGSDYGYYFLYDDLNRLVHAETERNSGGSDGEWDFAYHPNGSIDEMERHGQTFEYVYNTGKNQLDKVTHTGSTPPRNASATDNFLYDADGRMTSDASKRLTVTYDEATDRPYKFLIKDGSGDPVKAYYMVYDGAGNRVSKLEYTADATWAKSNHYFGSGEEYREFAGAGSVLVYAMDGFGRIAREGGDGPWALEIYLKNHLGSTVMVYHGQDEVYRTDYEPYGKLRGETESSDVPLTQKFTTKELDDGIDLTYFGARYYDQDLGVWTSPDKARQFHSAYTYASNNPVNHTDPDGNFDPEGTASAGLQIATGVSLTTLGASFTGSTAGIGSLFGGGTLMLAGGAETYMGAMNFLTSLVSPANPPAGTYLPSLVDMTIERAFMPSAKPMFEYAGLATDLTDAAKGGGLGMFSVGAWVTQQAFKSTAVPEIGNSARGVSPTDALQTTSPLRQK